MYFTLIGIVILVLTLFFVFFTRTRTLFYFTFFISAFTATSIINLPDSKNSILAYYVVGSFFILKVVYEIILGRYKLRKVKFINALLYFVVYAFMSLILPIVYSGNILVFTPDSPYDYVSFSFQNITQYIYLLFAFIIYLFSYIVMVNEEKINFKRIFNITALCVILLGFIQFVVPHEYFDFIFRTNYSHMVQYLETGLTRISSVNNEPSMLALFLTPLFVYYFIQMLQGFKRKILPKMDILMFILILVTSILNRSSSFYLGILIVIPFVILDFRREIFNIKNLKFLSNIKDKTISFSKENKVKTAVIILVVFVLGILFLRIVGFRFLILFTKLLGLGDSGSTRIELFSYHMSVFLKNLFTGVGFGTLRSNDLLSMWSAQVGLLGMIPIIYYFVTRLMYMFKNRNKLENRSFFYLILTTIVILLTSVPEPYYIYTWIYIAIIESIYMKDRLENNEIKMLKYKHYEIEQ